MVHVSEASDAGFVDDKVTRPYKVTTVLEFRSEEITFFSFSETLAFFKFLKKLFKSLRFSSKILEKTMLYIIQLQ